MLREGGGADVLQSSRGDVVFRGGRWCSKGVAGLMSQGATYCSEGGGEVDVL